MKRLIALLLLLALCVSVLPAHAAGADVTYARLVEMAEYLRQIASGDYMASNGVPEDVQRMAREWAAGIGGQPRLIVRMNVMDCAYVAETRAMFLGEHPMVLFEAESSAVNYIMNYTLVAAAYEQVVSETEYEMVMEANIQLNCEMLYAEAAESGTGMYLVFYEDATPILIISSAENGAVALNAFFVPSKKLAACQNNGQVALWFMLNGFTMTGTEVLPE